MNTTLKNMKITPPVRSSSCRWCGGPVDDTIPADRGGPLCVSGWSVCAGKVPFRLSLESIRDEERREADEERRRAKDKKRK